MSILFSFCIYGTDLKYHNGLLRNIREIPQKFPTAKIVVYMSHDIVLFKDIMENKYPHVILRTIEEPGSSKFMIYRLFAYDEFKDEFDYIFIRDADSSVVNNRDEWCIDQFVQETTMLFLKEKKDNNFDLHTIRDHYYHKSKFMVGLLGFHCKSLRNRKKDLLQFQIEYESNFSKENENQNRYNVDVDFATSYLTRCMKHMKWMIHCSHYVHDDIFVYPILCSLNNDGTNFAGNVLDEDGIPQFSFHAPYEINRDRKKTENNKTVSKKEETGEETRGKKTENNKTNEKKEETNEKKDETNEKKDETASKKEEIKREPAERYRKCFEMDDIRRSNVEIKNKNKNKKIIGTTYRDRIPAEDEFVIVYGNYCIDDRNVPTDESPQKVYRNAYFFMFHDKKDLDFFKFEYDPVWEPLGKIYVMNCENRDDRMVLTLCELAKLHVPFLRIHHYVGKIDKTVHKYVAATRNHADCVSDFLMSGEEYALFLEDDVTVIDSPEEQIKKFDTFFKRKYDFDVCLLATSRHFLIKPYDDLLSLSYQQCTTSSAYLLNCRTADKVFECFDTGVSKMLETGNTHDYCCDRYWSKLQADNKFFVFKDKIMYQSCTWSSLQQKPVMQFD